MGDRHEADQGLGEEIKGSAKKAAGMVTGQDDLEQEGEAQRQKADAAREAGEKQAEAADARSDAEALKAEQKAHED